MSLLAGFDYVFEISNATLLKMFKSTVTIDGVLLNPPFDLLLPARSGRLIVDDVQLDIEGDDTVNVSFAFSKSSFVPPVPVFNNTPVVLALLDGTLTIELALRLVPGPDNTRELILDMKSAVVRLVYSLAGDAIIASRLSTLGISVGTFKDGVAAAVTTVVRQQPTVAIPIPEHTVDRNRDGLINPGVWLTNLRVRCVGNGDRSRQAVSLLGNFFVGTQNDGNPVQKIETAILPGQDMAVSFSERAIHELVFCPSLATATATKIAELPPSCGSAAGMPVSDLTLTSLVDTFVVGAIHLSGRIAKSGFCYEATGSFTARSVPAVSADGGSIAFDTTVDEPDVDVDVDWYCELALVGLLGFFQLAVVAHMENVAAEAAAAIGKAGVRRQLQPGGVGAGSVPPNARLSSVTIVPGRMTLHGRIEVLVPFPDSMMFVAVSPTGHTEQLTGAVQDTWSTKLSCKPEAKPYVYTETQQRHESTFDITSRLVATPVTVDYSVRGGLRGIGDLPAASGPSIPLLSPFAGLSAGTGWTTVTIPAVDCTYPLPLGTGGTKVTQDVHLEYRIQGTVIHIANAQPSEGNFFVLLEAAVLDASGTAPPGPPPKAWVFFEGNSVVMDDEYMTDEAECALKSASKIPRHYIPKWKYEKGPSPTWQTFAQVQALKRMEAAGELRKGDVDRMLLQSQVAHGDATARAHRALTTGGRVPGDVSNRQS